MTTGIPIHWRLNSERYQLAGRICARCGYKMFPPKGACPECAEAVKWSLYEEGDGVVVDLRQLARRRFEAAVPSSAGVTPPR